MDNKLIQQAERYIMKRNVLLTKQLGIGIHGVVYVAIDKQKMERFAVKIHRYKEAYQRECAIYRRLAKLEVYQIQGCNVPLLLGQDDEIYAIEMTIVSRPFVLDFAGAYLDHPPDFPENVWDDWEKEKIAHFENDWPAVEFILAEFRMHGIFLYDISKNNISFRDPGYV